MSLLAGKVIRGPAPLSLALAHVAIDANDTVIFSPWTETAGPEQPFHGVCSQCTRALSPPPLRLQLYTCTLFASSISSASRCTPTHPPLSPPFPQLIRYHSISRRSSS